MPLLQTFETTILSAEHDFRGEILFIPNRSFRRPTLTAPGADAHAVIHRLGFQEIGQINESQLENAIALLLASPYHLRAYLHDPHSPAHFEYVTEEHRHFAREFATENLVPIEQSPLTTEALNKLIAQVPKGPVGLGTLAGVYVATGGTPMLLLWVPAGIILCCVAVGIGKGLQTGLQKKLQRLLRGQ